MATEKKNLIINYSGQKKLKMVFNNIDIDSQIQGYALYVGDSSGDSLNLNQSSVQLTKSEQGEQE